MSFVNEDPDARFLKNWFVDRMELASARPDGVDLPTFSKPGEQEHFSPDSEIINKSLNSPIARKEMMRKMEPFLNSCIAREQMLRMAALLHVLHNSFLVRPDKGKSFWDVTPPEENMIYLTPRMEEYFYNLLKGHREHLNGMYNLPESERGYDWQSIDKLLYQESVRHATHGIISVESLADLESHEIASIRALAGIRLPQPPASAPGNDGP